MFNPVIIKFLLNLLLANISINTYSTIRIIKTYYQSKLSVRLDAHNSTFQYIDAVHLGVTSGNRICCSISKP